MNRSPMRRKPSRGSGIPPRVREAVLLRDGHHCRRCGRSVVDFPASIHHRQLRSRGGDAALSNLVLLCGSGTTYCHGDVHAHPRQSVEDGFIVSAWADPAAEAVLSIGGWVLITDDGRVIPDEAHPRDLPPSLSREGQ